jgi:hypothetical protein
VVDGGATGPRLTETGGEGAQKWRQSDMWARARSRVRAHTHLQREREREREKHTHTHKHTHTKNTRVLAEIFSEEGEHDEGAFLSE